MDITYWLVRQMTNAQSIPSTYSIRHETTPIPQWHKVENVNEILIAHLFSFCTTQLIHYEISDFEHFNNYLQRLRTYYRPWKTREYRKQTKVPNACLFSLNTHWPVVKQTWPFHYIPKLFKHAFGIRHMGLCLKFVFRRVLYNQN